MISLGYFITLSGSGVVSPRCNHKRTIIISNTALGLALIGDTGSFGLGITISGGRIAAGAILAGSLKFNDPQN